MREYVARYNSLALFISIPQVRLFAPKPLSLSLLDTNSSQLLKAFTVEMLQEDVDWKDMCTLLYSPCSSVASTFFTATTGWKNLATLVFLEVSVFVCASIFQEHQKAVYLSGMSSLPQSHSVLPNQQFSHH